MRYLLLLLLTTTLAFAPAASHDLFDQIYTGLPGSTCQDAKIHEDDKATAKRVVFLNREFRTGYFSAATSVKYMECEDRRFHLGIVSLTFKNEQDFDYAMLAITSSNRNGFRLPTPTRFAPKRLGNELVIVYSETFNDRRFKDIVNER